MGRITLSISMNLLSDAIFGSGLSIPGGEDIAVRVDAAGFPYLPGSALKGMLRESTENLLCWGGAPCTILYELFGASGWENLQQDRRVFFTSLTLSSPPQEPAECFATRCFTALENGIVKEGSLRQAQCIKAGLVFTGTLCCDSGDQSLIRDALSAIKWVGMSKSRGFGRVRFSTQKIQEAAFTFPAPTSGCIHYRLHTQLPLIMTDAAKSQENQWETLSYIPGSSMRGLVLNALSNQEPEAFRQNKEALLRNVQFLNAYPCPADGPVLPSIKGFYENKEETQLQSVVTSGTFDPDFKRAKLGSFCTLEGETIRYWSAATNGLMRIQKPKDAMQDAKPFLVRHIEAGQDFEGYILAGTGELAQKICNILPQTPWLGADRYAGYGKCTLTILDTDQESPRWCTAFGYTDQSQLGQELYLLALSPLTMTDEKGDPCGISLEALAAKLGLQAQELTISCCSTSLSTYSGFNRMWQSWEPKVTMYDAGSLFKLTCSQKPDWNKLLETQRQGLGIRKTEGYGQILFLRPDLYEKISRKESIAFSPTQAASQTANARNAHTQWLQAHRKDVEDSSLSDSQLGQIQAYLQASLEQNDLSQLETYLEAHIYRKVQVPLTLRDDFGQFLHRAKSMNRQDRDKQLKLVIQLLDHCRKGGR